MTVHSYILTMQYSEFPIYIGPHQIQRQSLKDMCFKISCLRGGIDQLAVYVYTHAAYTWSVQFRPLVSHPTSCETGSGWAVIIHYSLIKTLLPVLKKNPQNHCKMGMKAESTEQ